MINVIQPAFKKKSSILYVHCIISIYQTQSYFGCFIMIILFFFDFELCRVKQNYSWLYYRLQQLKWLFTFYCLKIAFVFTLKCLNVKFYFYQKRLNVSRFNIYLVCYQAQRIKILEMRVNTYKYVQKRSVGGYFNKVSAVNPYIYIYIYIYPVDVGVV